MLHPFLRLQNSIFKILRSSLLKRKVYFKPLFVFHFVACFKKSLYYNGVSQIGVAKLRWGLIIGMVFTKLYTQRCVCVLGLRWMELTFDLCDCISCSQEAQPVQPAIP